VTTATFILIHLAPGDPIGAGLDDPRVPQAVRAHWRAVYGLDQPLALQFVRYLAGAARGQFGYSFTYNESVSTILARALPRTIVLAGSALVLSFVAGIAMALIQVARHGTAADRAIGVASLAVYSLPEFWLGQVALLTFAYVLPIFPAGGMVDPVMHPYMGPLAAFWDRIDHLILPALTLSILSAAGIARFQRAALLDVAADDYLRTARAKGVPERSVLMRHALRNAALPVITLFGLALPGFLGGTVFIEKVFSWPGIGSLAVDAVSARDYPVVIACAVLGSILVAGGSFVADFLYAVADPRLRRATGPVRR
jgi:peptide/nickel transport system permease protein